MASIRCVPVQGIEEITPGFDLAAAIAARANIEHGDILVVAHKAISKSEGATRKLSTAHVAQQARALGLVLDKDPRLVQVILDESKAVVRAERGVLITETHHGFVCANAGVDASNLGSEDEVLLLPRDPDASASVLRRGVARLTGVTPGVVISDSFGRAWRTGQADVAIGVAGLAPLEDWRGRSDPYGRELHATVIAVADQMTAAADLARRKDSRQPVVLIRGAGRHVLAEDGPGVAPLLRDRESDLFR
ncbi:MAG: coenzyme F420-0:L-glutamate ligase [Solirubrobacterales bacterium]|nr:coenzyme F420-0:L-glutamate ligase [Solirubrobacterales bacterium]